MGTRALIAKETPTGELVGIYLHFDGGSRAYKILSEHYLNSDKVDDLIEHGDCSVLGEQIGAEHDFNERIPGWCKFYHRDRKEKLNIRNWRSLKSFVQDDGVDYHYVFRNGGWDVVSYVGQR